VWAFRVTIGGRIVFESRGVSIRFMSREAASQIAELVEALDGAVWALAWRGDPADDCSATWGRFGAHAEHIRGPRRGGSWYCSVFGSDGERYFHTADENDVQPRSGQAARWICELVVAAGDLGIVKAYAE
jgi:hypothetical protein